jgi:hypothetical protein
MKKGWLSVEDTMPSSYPKRNPPMEMKRLDTTTTALGMVAGRRAKMGLVGGEQRWMSSKR